MESISEQLADAICTALYRLDNVTAMQDSEADSLGQAENVLRDALLTYAARAQAAQPAGEHTAEPWHAPSAGIYAGNVMVASVGGRDVTTAMRKAGRLHEQIYNARRIVACVNACAGIPTELLESLDLGELDAAVNDPGRDPSHPQLGR